MLKIRFAALAAVALAVAAVTASAQQMTQAGVPAVLPDGKIAVINTQAFPGGISELKVKYEQVENQFKDRFNRLQSLEQQLKQLETDLQAKRGVLSADKLQEMQADYELKKRQGQRDLEDMRGEYTKAEDVATRPVREKIYQFLQNYATQRSIVLIINLPGAAQTGSLAYWSPGADITQDFITEYNKANPVAGAPAAQPRPNPPPPANKPAGKP